MAERPLTAQVAPGQDVICADGEAIGVVQDVTTKQFQVRPEHGRDFWLDRQLISQAEGGAIRMGFAGKELDTFKLTARDADLTDAEAAPPVGTLGVLEDDAARQRFQMERELAAQRERMRERRADRSSPEEPGGTLGETVEQALARGADERAATASGHASTRPTMAIRDARVFRGMPVKGARDGRAVGTVKDLLFDPDEKAVSGVLVSSTTREAPGVFVARSHIERFGEDAVTVDSEVPISRPVSPGTHERTAGMHLEGVRVVTDAGNAVGRIDRVLVDERGGIAGYHTKSGILGLGSKHDIAPADVVSIHEEALVVRAGLS